MTYTDSELYQLTDHALIWDGDQSYYEPAPSDEADEDYQRAYDSRYDDARDYQ